MLKIFWVTSFDIKKRPLKFVVHNLISFSLYFIHHLALGPFDLSKRFRLVFGWFFKIFVKKFVFSGFIISKFNWIDEITTPLNQSCLITENKSIYNCNQ